MVTCNKRNDMKIITFKLQVRSTTKGKLCDPNLLKYRTEFVYIEICNFRKAVNPVRVRRIESPLIVRDVHIRR